ncbi:AraC family transcriptional regulator [Rhizobium sp. LjRoot98]|uniref:AraC family transcriptional regulator n=1 Tax=unclassified Rhizobium TaxID=2613769 RepID=UPI0007142F02|nr:MULTISPECIES: AraC family transcriptional regulator [unclassified Rhizobium]KQV31479.1 AraC family transcriptional regulator [Rhizobium sp. Root1204]KQY11137.1 AraC family transcriptional regulator [Rhizobium sp. Root1334]KRC05125.1 AraC family transcriptional regulator [Rhizobium sp. Root73]
MKEDSIWAVYEQRLRRVSAYIYDHLDEELDLDRLSDIACMSPHHWHRVYRAVHGETLATTVKRLRLHRAAGDLVQTSLSVEEIARRTGYPNLQSFTRIFKSVFGMPPARYRREGSHTVFQSANGKGFGEMYNVTMKTIAPRELTGVSHTGSYMGIGRAFETLGGTLQARKLYRQDMKMVGIYLDDPDLVAEDKLRSFACVTEGQHVPADEPLVRKHLEGGEYAVLRHKGPYADMHKAYQWLYGEWLPSSGREVRDTVRFEEYINNPRDAAPKELLTDIYLPVK